MRKANFWRIAGILLAALFIMAGCSGGGGAGGGLIPSPILVESVSVTDAAGQSSSTIWTNVGANPDGLPTSVTLTATVSPPNASDKTVNWAKDTGYATLSATTGASITVNAAAVGTVVITAKTADGYKEDTYTVTVEDATSYVAVTGVAIWHDGADATSLSFDKVGENFGGAKQLTLQFTPSNGTPKSTVWSVTPAGVVTVENGVVTPVGVGDATVTVTINNDVSLTDSVTVSVNQVAAGDPVETVEVTPDAALTFTRTGIGPWNQDSVTLSAEVSPATAYDGVIWTSTNQAAVTVVEGVVTPVGTGTAKVYATSVGVDADGETVKSNEIDVTVTVLPEPVVSVSVTPTGPLSFSKTDTDLFFTPTLENLNAVVLPAGTNQAVTWTSDNTDAVEVSINGVVTPVGAGTAKVYATSVGFNSSGVTVKSNEVSVTVTVGGTTPDAELALYNQAASPTVGTTTDLEAAWNDTTKKYTIKNVETGGEFVAGGNAGLNGVKNATFVYLNTPLTGTTMSISARVRIKAIVAQDPSDSHGVIMGMMADPQGVDPQGPKVPFFGMRATTKSLWRPYNSRNNAANTSSALTVANSSGFSEENIGTGGTNTYISRIDDVVIPFDEEFILEMERTSATAYTVRLKDYAENLIATASYSNTVLGNMAIEYPGFIVANAEVEISQITIKDGGTEVFSTDTTSPTPTPVASVEFIAPAVGIEGDATNGYTYTHPTSAGTELTLTAKALPTRAPQNISWAITGASPATANTASVDLTGIPTTNNATVTATASAEGKSATLTITVTTGSILVQTIDISAAGDATSITAGSASPAVAPETLQFSADVQPGNATIPTVTWSVSNSSTYSSSTSADGGSINASGVLTADTDLAADTNIWVFAKATDSSNTVSDGVQIQVKKYVAPVDKWWNFSDAAFDSLPTTDWGSSPPAAIDGLTFDNQMSAIASTQSLGGYSFTRALNMSGTGTVGTRRCPSFDVGGPCFITVYLYNSNSGSRNITVTGATTETQSVAGSTAATLEFTITSVAKTYLYTNNAGPYVYAIRVTYLPTVKITAGGTTITAGDTDTTTAGPSLQFTATEYTADNLAGANVSSTANWSIKDADGAVLGPTSTIATISNSGELFAGYNLDADKEIWVFAEKGGKTSLGYKVTVKKYVGGGGETGLTLKKASIGSSGTTASYDGDTKVLTMSGSGNFGNSAQNGNFVYVEITGDFTAQVKLDQFLATSGDNTRAGLHVFNIDPDRSEGKTGIPTGNTVPYFGVNIRGSATVAYQVGRAPAPAGSQTASSGNSSANSLGNGTRTSPMWFRIVKSGNSYTPYVSSDGNSWTPRAAVTMDFGDVSGNRKLYLGFLTSDSDTKFSEFTINDDEVDLSPVAD